MSPMFGKLYEFELKFVNSSPLNRIEKLSSRTMIFSATWNNWLVDSTIDQVPYYLKMEENEIKKSLLGLIHLVKKETNGGQDEVGNTKLKSMVNSAFFGFSERELLVSLLKRFNGPLKKEVKKLISQLEN